MRRHKLVAVDGMLRYSLQELVHWCFQIRTFYCYDLFTFTTAIAALCGCEVRIIAFPPFDDLRALYEGIPYATLGVALGDSPQEVERARVTRPALRKEIEAIYHGRRSYAFPLEKSAPGYSKTAAHVADVLQQLDVVMERRGMPTPTGTSPLSPPPVPPH